MKKAKETILKEVINTDIRNLQHTLDELDEQTFQSAVDMIAKARKVYIVGVRNCAPLAEILWSGLHMVMEQVVLVRTNSSSDLFEQMIHVSEKDVVIGISFPRYSVRTLKALEFANNRSAKVITITDCMNSPINLYSSCNLTAKSGLVSVVDSFVAPLSVINALISALCLKKRNKVMATMEEMYRVWDEYQVYGSDDFNPITSEVRLKNEEEKYE